MKKKSYLKKLKKYQHAAANACRTDLYKAAVAHIYGSALELQFDCAYGSIPDKTYLGQKSAIYLADICWDILDQSIAKFDAKQDSLNVGLEVVYNFLNKKNKTR